MQEPQRGDERVVKVLQEERLAVQSVDGDVISAIRERASGCQASRRGERVRRDNRPLHERDGLLLGPYLFKGLRIDLPLRENIGSDGPLDRGLYAHLSRDVR